MTDRAKKITELTAITSPASTDLLIIETDPSGTPATKKITLQNLLNAGYITSNAYQVANTSSSGVIKVGDQLSVNATGHLNVNLNTANTTSAGVIKVGNNVSVNATGFLSANLTDYVTSTNLSSNLANYVAGSNLSSNLAGYVTTTNLSSNLAGYVSSVALTAVLDEYVANTDIANTTVAGIIKVGTNLSVNASGFLNNDLSVPAFGVQRISTSGTTAANLSAKFILCDPNAATANITVQLPNTGISDGREFVIKNINDGGNIVTVVVPGLQIEGLSGLGSNATLSNTAYTGHWVWDQTSTVYRAVNIYTPA
jgi:hypothetical protein